MARGETSLPFNASRMEPIDEVDVWSAVVVIVDDGDSRAESLQNELLIGAARSMTKFF
jgi:hypothetical protein